MSSSFHLGTVKGLRVDVNWSVLVIVGLVTWSLAAQGLPDSVPGHPVAMYWVAAAAGAIALLASVLVHELAHALVAERLGVKVEGITLWMFGGISKLGGHAKDARSELRIAIVGPAASAAIGGASILAAAVVAATGGPELLVSTLEWLAFINVVLAVFNMLPGAPLDGGRVLAAVLWRRSGDEHGSRIRAAAAGRVVGQVLIGLGIVEFVLLDAAGLWLMLIGWFLTNSARAEGTAEELVDVFGDVRVGDVMSAAVETVRNSLTVQEFVDRAMTLPISSYPVVDERNAVLGLVTLRQVRTLPVGDWRQHTVGELATPLQRLVVAAPTDLLVDVLQGDQWRTAGHRSFDSGRILVFDHGNLVGIITPTDLSRLFERRQLKRPALPPPAALPAGQSR